MRELRTTRTVERARVAEPTERYLAKAAAHREAGRLLKARRNLQLVLEAAPDHPGAHYELGILSYQAGQPSPAIPHFVAALRAAPGKPAYWLALASTLLKVDRVDEARAIMERFRDQGLTDAEARSVVASFAELAYTEGQARYDADDLPAAETLFDLALTVDETHSGATYYAGAIAARTNRLERAYDLVSIAIYREPQNAAYFCTLGVLLTTMNDYDGAVSALEKAIALDPTLAIAHANIAGVFQRRNQYSAATRHARQAIALDPTTASGHINLGASLKSSGDLAGAIAAYDKALAIDPGNVAAHSNRLFAKLYAGSDYLDAYVADARAFGARLADPLLRERPFANDRDPDRRLRIGFVSGDLCGHAVARFLEPFLEHVDGTVFDILAYMTNGMEDAVSARLRSLFGTWHNIAGLNDDEAADLIEADAIDILVDLSGHSAGHRLLVLARKPAPVQVTWMGHPATTGLRAIDYRLTDDQHDQPGVTDADHTEALWRLEGVSATYRAPDDIPPVRATMPYDDNGYVTFGVLNRFEKIGDAALRTWAGVLRDVPDARLFMVVGDVEAPEIRTEVERRLANAGPPLDRVRLQPRVGSGYFALYHQVDIALDSFPYNGGTTSCETLCMGVPLIALRGRHAISRGGVVVLTAAGLEELVGDTPHDYAARAVALARDSERLRAIRSGLRERVYASRLMDHARLASEVGNAFRAMWRRWLDATRSA